MDEEIFLVDPQNCTEHSFHDLVRFFNGRSAYGDKICQKCGTLYHWQYDFPEVTLAGETKPY